MKKMKTLKLYGSKDLPKGIDREHTVAEIAVIDGKVCVGSEHPDVKRDLKAALVKLMASGGVEMEKETTGAIENGTRYSLVGIPQKPTDPQFLEALKGDAPFWWENRFGGYEINPLVSRVVEE